MVEDLHARGLNKKVLLVVTGEFGRTPRISNRKGSKTQIEQPRERPLTPNDLWATVYRHLGVDYNKTFDDHTGRPMSILPFGAPIRELQPVS